MIITTESLISECQKQKAKCLNKTLNDILKKSLNYTNTLNIPFDLTNCDIRRIIVHNSIIEFCELNKKHITDIVFYIKKEEFNEEYIRIIDEVIDKMELNKSEKSKHFIRKFNKYLKKNGFTYLSDVYLKQATNKLALFR